MKKWWRLAVLRRALVVFSHAPSLDRPNLHENWQVLRDSHPPGRIWRPTRPLGHLGPVVPGAGSAPAPSAWKAVMHLSTPPGYKIGLPSRSSLGGVRARRRPLDADYGATVFCCHFVASEDWWSWTVTLRLVRIASAACCYYHHSPKAKWTRRRELHPR